MNLKTILIGAGLFLLGRSAVRKYQIYDQATFSLQKISIGGGLLRPVIYLEIGVNNPTTAQVVLTELVGKLYLNDKFAADVVQTGSAAIKPGVSTLKLIATPSTGIIDAVLSAIQNKRGLFELRGTVKVNGVLLPMIKSYSL